MRMIMKTTKPDHVILKTKTDQPLQMKCVQQVADSVDCGVIVCYHLENFILNRLCDLKVFKHDISAQYRKKMVEWFLDPLNIEV